MLKKLLHFFFKSDKKEQATEETSKSGHTLYDLDPMMTYYIGYEEYKILTKNETHEAFKRASNYAEVFLKEDLIPIIVWSPMNQMLYVTSRERLQGQFNQ